MQRGGGDDARLGQSDRGVPMPQVRAARAVRQYDQPKLSGGWLSVPGTWKFIGTQSDNAIRHLRRVPKRILHLPTHGVAGGQPGKAHAEFLHQSVYILPLRITTISQPRSFFSEYRLGGLRVLQFFNGFENAQPHYFARRIALSREGVKWGRIGPAGLERVAHSNYRTGSLGDMMGRAGLFQADAPLCS